MTQRLLLAACAVFLLATGLVWGLVQDGQGSWQNEMLYGPVGRITSFGQDEQGEVYLVDQGGSLYVLDAK